MNTDELVAALARNAAPVATGAAPRRLATAAAAGMALALPMVIWLLGLNPLLADLTGAPMFWVKLGFVATLFGGALVAVLRLARPGVRLARAPLAIALPVILMWVLAAHALLVAGPDERSALVFGTSARACPWNIALLALPTFVATLWALKGLAPTRLRLAGAAAGLLAGTAGALVYVLHCPELAAPFLGLWYLIGMLLPAAVGAAIGPRVLRW